MSNKGYHGGSSRGGGRPRPPRDGSVNPRMRLPELPDSYFADDAKGNPCLRTEFVSRDKMNLMAEILGKVRLTRSQMRRFFNHCRDIEHKIKVGGETWEQVAGSFEALSSHAAYASSSRKVPSHFQKFIEDNVKRVTSYVDPRLAFLDGFMPHFEALVGFSYDHLKPN